MKRENILAPSILAADFTRLGEDIQTVAAAGHLIHQEDHRPVL